MKSKIALVHGTFKNLDKIGGAEVTSLWILEALKSAYDVTLISIFPDSFLNNLERLNALYGTTLKKTDFTIYNVENKRFSFFIDNLWALRFHFVMKKARLVSKDYNLLFSTLNEMDLGKPGIQYFHYPVYQKKWGKKFLMSLIKYQYRQLIPILFGYSETRMKENVSLANSAWTKKAVDELYDMKSIVVYPPTQSYLSNSFPFSERADGFVCIGRISPEKRIGKIIKIIGKLRKRGHDVDLHIIGPRDNLFYYLYIKLLIKNKSWVHLEGQLEQKTLRTFVHTNKYGIHAMENEHFGIVIAEMISAGCIVFAPSSGGQQEILNNNKYLLYDNIEDAVGKIEKVLTNPALQKLLSSALSTHAAHFSSKNFIKQIQIIVNNILLKH